MGPSKLKKAYRSRWVEAGQVVVSENPYEALEIEEIASGLAVVGISRRPMVAGVTYFLLPENNGNNSDDATVNKGLYANHCINELLTVMARHDATPERAVYYLVGGAQLFPSTGIHLQTINLGLKNIIVAQSLLAQQQCKLAGKETGGHQGRHIFVGIRDGQLQVTTASQETKYFNAP